MALPNRRIDIYFGDPEGSIYLRSRLAADGALEGSVNSTGPFADRHRRGSQWNLIQAAYSEGAPIYFHRDGTVYALDSDDVDSAGSPVVVMAEPWMIDLNPFLTEADKIIRQASGAVPALSATAIIPAESVTSETVAGVTLVHAEVPFDWWITANGEPVRITKLSITTSPTTRGALIRADTTVSLEGLTLRAEQGSNVVKDVLDASNGFDDSGWGSFVADSRVTVTVEEITMSEITRLDDRIDSLPAVGIVGTVGLVKIAAAKPSAPTGVTWDRTDEQLANIPAGWTTLADYDENDIGTGGPEEHAWFSFSYIGNDLVPTTWSDPGYGGDGQVQYSADLNTWHSTKTDSDQWIRYHRGDAWSEPIDLVPRQQGSWHVAATINWASQAARVISITPIPISTISEIQFRWRARAANDDITCVRLTQTIPAMEVRRMLRSFDNHFTNTPDGISTLVLMGYANGTLSDVYPLHSAFALNAVTNEVDVGFQCSLMRPSGQDSADSIGAFGVHKSSIKSSGVPQKAWIDLLVK